MKLTEQEAKDKWCPMVRYSPLGNTGDSYRECTTRGEGCIASECMFWRWSYDPESYMGKSIERKPTDERWVCKYCEGKGCDECEGEGSGFKYAPVGYCGLAGAIHAQ